MIMIITIIIIIPITRSITAVFFFLLIILLLLIIIIAGSGCNEEIPVTENTGKMSAWCSQQTREARPSFYFCCSSGWYK